MGCFISKLAEYLEALRLTLPGTPVEPVDIAIIAISEMSTMGELIAPSDLHTSRDFVWHDFPTSNRVWAGFPLQFQLVLTNIRHRVELDIAWASITEHICVEAHSISNARAKTALKTMFIQTIQPVERANDVTILVEIPDDIQTYSEIVVSSILFAGHNIAPSFALPMKLRVAEGMHAPLRLKRNSHCSDFRLNSVPVITPDGHLYSCNKDSDCVSVFAADGTGELFIDKSFFSLTRSRLDLIACYQGTLLLADSKAERSEIAAYDKSGDKILWERRLEYCCLGIAVLPLMCLPSTEQITGTPEGIFFSSQGNYLEACRLSDGSCINNLSIPSAFSNTYIGYLAADVTARTIYAEVCFPFQYEVAAFYWDGTELANKGLVEAADVNMCRRLLAVVPPNPQLGVCTACLVVGSRNQSLLRVISLPDHRLVHTHDEEGVEITGLAADPSGCALAICDARSHSIHVLSWPLPGMSRT